MLNNTFHLSTNDVDLFLIILTISVSIFWLFFLSILHLKLLASLRSNEKIHFIIIPLALLFLILSMNFGVSILEDL